METIFILVLVTLLLISIFTKGKTFDTIYKILFGVALVSMTYYAFLYPEKFYYAVLIIVISLPMIIKNVKKNN